MGLRLLESSSQESLEILINDLDSNNFEAILRWFKAE